MMQPIVCIDLKKNRIRVHKVTLHLLGDPEYIQLLINPQSGSLVIRKTVAEDYLRLRVREELLMGDCYEINSKALMEKLRIIHNDWEKNCSYRIYGRIIGNVAEFNMKDIVPIKEDVE